MKKHYYAAKARFCSSPHLSGFFVGCSGSLEALPFSFPEDAIKTAQELCAGTTDVTLWESIPAHFYEGVRIIWHDYV